VLRILVRHFSSEKVAHHVLSLQLICYVLCSICCRYSWQNDDRCKLAATNKYRQGDGSSGDSPTIILYYPTDLTLGICDNNVSQRPNSFVDLGYTLFLTAEDCCKYW